MATVRFDRFLCQQAQDVDGTDEAYLAFFLDGEYIGNVFQAMRSGEVLSMGFELEFDSQLRLQLWEVDDPSAGNPHDFLGEVVIENGTSGTGVFERSGARYRVEWSGVDTGGAPPILVRRDQANMSSAERTRFRDAILTLIENGTFGRLFVQHAGPTGSFEFLNHAFVAPSSVSLQRFLPWHRVYLRRLEEALQAIDGRIFLPYWRGSIDRDIPAWLADFTPSVPHTASATNGQPSPFVVTRDPGRGTSMPIPSDISFELQPSDYSTMTERLEGGSHGQVHVWIGGTMFNAMVASADILFWLHHCEVDRLWAVWQRTHSGGPSLAGPNRIMQPWDEDFSQVLNTVNFGYTYG